MHRAVILLACACAAYAIPQDLDELSLALEDQTPDDSVFEWPPPSYSTYLHNTDATIAKITSHFTPEALQNKNDTDFRYVVATYVIYALADRVSVEGWKVYDDNYDALVKEHIKLAVLDPKQAANLLKCYFSQSTQFAIYDVRQIIESDPVSFICRVHLAWCDVAIWTVLRKVGSDADISSAHTLEIAGAASALFLKDYAHTLEAVSKLNVYRYLLYAENEFRPLVAAYKKLLKKVRLFRVDGCVPIRPEIK